MANLCRTYVGGAPVPAPEMHIGPILGIADRGSVQVERVTGSGDVGAYDVEVSNTNDHYCTIFNRNTEGIALYVMGSPLLFHRVSITRVPEAGTTVRVCIVIDDGGRA